MFLVEVKQAGLSHPQLHRGGHQAGDRHHLPGGAVPYARAAISHLVTQGGFPQFLLPPVNFEALYAADQQPPQTTN